ncbi:MAG: hypothetical protein JWP11_3700 [Frankiales bacterium]|nr:hypothetical protein [Frankiales bacterium]
MPESATGAYQLTLTDHRNGHHSGHDRSCVRCRLRSLLGRTPSPTPPDETPPPAIDAEHLAHQREWSERTFGPGPRTKGVLDHIRKELAEIEADPSDVTEWVDVVILALDGAWRAGWEPQEIIDAIKAKQAKNEARTWPDWRTMSADRAIEHDRSQDCPCDHDGPHGFCHAHFEALIGGVCECPRPTRASGNSRGGVHHG